MLSLSVTLLAALAAVANAAPQAVSSAATTGTVTAASDIGESTSNVFPPTGSKC